MIPVHIVQPGECIDCTNHKQYIVMLRDALMAFRAAIECLEDSERTRADGAELIEVAKAKMYEVL